MSETNQFVFELITPAGVMKQQTVASVILPSEVGIIQVLPKHRELISLAEPGEVVMQLPNGEKEVLVVAGGVVEVVDDRLRLLADTAVPLSELDLAAAEAQAQQLAKDLESQDSLDIASYEALQKQLAMEKVKITALKKWR